MLTAEQIAGSAFFGMSGDDKIKRGLLIGRIKFALNHARLNALMEAANLDYSDWPNTGTSLNGYEDYASAIVDLATKK